MPTYIDVIKFEEETPANTIRLSIGNLSSQLFSNVYMNVFEQYVKRKQKCRHYGRYVDDAYIVSDDREYLKKLIPEISSFFKEEGLRRVLFGNNERLKKEGNFDESCLRFML